MSAEKGANKAFVSLYTADHTHTKVDGDDKTVGWTGPYNMCPYCFPPEIPVVYSPGIFKIGEEHIELEPTDGQPRFWVVDPLTFKRIRLGHIRGLLNGQWVIE